MNNNGQENKIVGYDSQTGLPIYETQNLNNQTQISNNIQQNNTYNKPCKKNNKKPIWIILCLAFVFIVLGVVLLTIFGVSKNGRTIMIYMVGSDLESENRIASYDLEDIIPTNIDLKNNNIVLMVGGAAKWHNFVNENETAIYELTSSGFNKVKSYEVTNMGKSNTLTEFLKYSSEKYKSKKYDLIFWNHGIGVAGVGMDNISNDYLSIKEFSYALKNSPFNKNNKMESILFLTCLTGNLQFANVVDDYAKYMIASEELSWAGPYLDKLNFLEKIETTDTGIEYGKKFINHFKKSVEYMNNTYKNDLDSTYSVIDLSKIDKLQNSLDDFISDIDVKTNYKQIVHARNNLVQYGLEDMSYDTIDLYKFVTNLKNLSSEKADKLLKIIEETVLYNWSLNDYSNGISVYFPYRANKNIIDLQLGYLSGIDNSKYYSFISTFNDVKNDPKQLSYSLINSTASATKTDFQLQLTEEQKDNFASASFMVFRDMGDGYYMPMYQSSKTKLNDNGLLTAQYSGKALKVIDSDDNSSETILLIEDKQTDELNKYYTYVTMNSYNEENGIDVVSGNLYLTVDKNSNIKISKITKLKKDVPSNSLLSLEDYIDIYYMNYKYKILDDNGKYTENWDSSGIAYMFRTGTKDKDYSFKISELDDGYKYYCVFKVYDIYNNYHYSNLIPMN